MLAAYVDHFDAKNPLAGLRLGQQPEPVAGPHWTVVNVRAASLNHHDLWSLRGVGLKDTQLPMILGTDAAGVTDAGDDVIVHGVIGADGHGVGPTERRSLLSEKYPGALAERVMVPTANLIPKPAKLSFEEAACLPTAWLTAYRLLFRAADLRPGDSVLIQGAGGGLASAAITLAVAAGLEVFATSRSAEKRDRALALGAVAALRPGERMPKRVDAVIESVGAATWSHSAASVRPGGTIAVAGATTGDANPAELTRIFFNEITVQGVTMGSREDLSALTNFLVQQKVRPVIDSVLPLSEAKEGLQRLFAGEQFGKVVLVP